MQKCEVHTTVCVVWLHNIGVRAFWCAVHTTAFTVYLINKLFYFQLHAECAMIRMVDLLVVVAILYVLHLPVVVSNTF